MTTDLGLSPFDAKWIPAWEEYEAAISHLSDVEYEQAMKMRAIPDEVQDTWTNDHPQWQELIAPIVAAKARLAAAFAVVERLRSEVLDAVELPDDEGPWG